MNVSKHLSSLYMDAENAVTEIRKACDCSDCEELTNADLEALNTARYELETLKGYIDTALGEIALELEKFYAE